MSMLEQFDTMVTDYRSQQEEDVSVFWVSDGESRVYIFAPYARQTADLMIEERKASVEKFVYVRGVKRPWVLHEDNTIEILDAPKLRYRVYRKKRCCNG